MGFMTNSNNGRLCRAIALGAALLSAPLAALENERIKLPELGNSSAGIISLQQEYNLGRAFLKSLRGQVRTVSDPIIQDYVENLIYQLARFSELKDRRLDIVVVDNASINAFAVPGGVIGIHNGLLHQADTEAQLASVLSHELAHLSQRHFARRIEEQQRNTIPNMAGLLAGVIVAATAGGEAGMAAITAVQAAGLQNQLRYSRLNEQEADRVGMQTMIRADMDPSGAAGMFEKMQRAARYAGNRPPEFLLTHPVTESRINDARNRARQQQKKIIIDSTPFQLIKARVAISFSNNSKETVARYRSKLANSASSTDAEQYAMVLALTANDELVEAQQIVDILRGDAPQQIIYAIAEAQILIDSGATDKAIDLLHSVLAVNPGNHPTTMTLATALLKAGRPQLAETVLLKHSANNPNNPSVWYLLAETHGLAGNIVGVHRARAEFFVLNGVLSRATKQLGYALPLVKNNHHTASIIEQRMKEIKRLELAMQQL